MYTFYKSRFYQSYLCRVSMIVLFFLSQSSLFAQALPDLTVSNLVISLPSVIPNQTESYFFDVKNSGTAASTVAFSYRAYLSTDTVLSTNDIDAGIFPPATEPIVAAGFSARFSLYYIPNTTVPSGNYYIILKVDHNNLVRESNENNNIAVSTTTFTLLPNPPAADLTLANLNISTPSVLAGQIINYKVDLKNLGRNTPTDFKVNAYLSTDNILTATDPLVGGFPATTMGPNQVITQLPATATVPATLAAGRYFLIVKIDANTQVNELNEDNNVLASATPITVTNSTTGGGTYCASKATSPWEMWVANVNLGTINNTSQQFKEIGKAGYSDYTNVSASLAKGQVYPIQITANASWGGNFPNVFCRVWIDYNKNNVFEDSEKAFEQSGNTILGGFVSIPASAAVGAVRMRVSVKFGSYPTPCEAFAKGEVEDYTLNIQTGTASNLPDLDIALNVTTALAIYKPYTAQNYRITAVNKGNTAFSDVKIKFTRPALTASGGTKIASIGTFRDFCSGNIECSEWTIPALAVGATATLDAPVFILAPTGGITATATLLSSTPTDNVVANNTAAITLNPATTAAQAPSSQALAFRVPTQLIPVVIQRIAPNPTGGDILIKLDSWTKQTVDFNFSDITGKIIHSEKRDVEKGVNWLDFEVFHLPQGVYFIQTNVGKGRDVPTKFVKM